MKATKDECNKCGGISTLRHPEGAIQCLECGHQAQPPYAAGRHTTPAPVHATPAPVITVGRYHKPDGYPTRNFAVHLDGSLLAVTVYRKGAEAVRLKFMEVFGDNNPTQVEITSPQG